MLGPVAMLARSLFFLALALALLACGQHTRGSNAASLASKQAQVAERGRSVMPFDINRTLHHFRKQPSGGVEQVVSIDSDPQQVSLIRQHLQAEAARFQHGNYSDPGTIHGPDMPGLSAVARGARHIDIRYTQIPTGAQIAYATADPALVGAIHTWFDAQVKEHGLHAMPM
jgi:hypothetical protein